MQEEGLHLQQMGGSHNSVQVRGTTINGSLSSCLLSTNLATPVGRCQLLKVVGCLCLS